MGLRALFVLSVAAAFAVPTSAAAGSFPHFGSGCARDDFTSGTGMTVRAELCRSAAPGPAVIVLHGCGGFSTFDHRLVAELPRYGISTLDLDYFALTPPPGRRGFCGAPGAIGAAIDMWISTTRSAAAALRANGFRRVGVVGWSLGGAVAIASAAAPPTSRVFGAVAAFSSGAFGAQELAAQMPPTILLSAGRTDAIPVNETLPLYRALRQAHVPSQLYVFPNGSHQWPRGQGTLGIEHAARFLNTYLR